MLYLQNGQGNALSAQGQGNALSAAGPWKCSICTGPRKFSIYRTAKEMLYLQQGQGNALSTVGPQKFSICTGPRKCSIRTGPRKCSIYRTAKEMLYLTVTPPFEAPITPREQRDKRLGQGTQRSVTARCSPARPDYTTLCTGAVPTLQTNPVLTNRDKRQQSRGSGWSKPRLHLWRTLFRLIVLFCE